MMTRTTNSNATPASLLLTTRRRPPQLSWLAAAVASSVLLGLVATALPQAAEAQEIQLTGPLAGAPAVRKMRVLRKGRAEIAPAAAFSILDPYRRTIMPTLRVNYHPLDWVGVGVWAGYGFQFNTHLTSELQKKAVDGRACTANPSSDACRITQVNLTRKGAGGATGILEKDQLGRLQWMVAPQVTFIPFRGKINFFSNLVVDTDVSLFVGPAFVGVKERADCGRDKSGKALTSCTDSFELKNRIGYAPTFGVGLNFYPTHYLGFGAEWRAVPLAWNTSGFDSAGGGKDENFSDNAVNSKDRSFQMNNMVSVHLSVALPTKLKTTD